MLFRGPWKQLVERAEGVELLAQEIALESCKVNLMIILVVAQKTRMLVEMPPVKIRLRWFQLGRRTPLAFGLSNHVC